MTTQPDYWDAMNRDELVAKFKGSVKSQPDQNKDWLDVALGKLAEDLIAYDNRMTEAGAPNIRFVHKYLKKTKAAILAHQQAAIDKAVADVRACRDVYFKLAESQSTMSWLDEILESTTEWDDAIQGYQLVDDNAKEKIITKLLNLIEQSKEKNLPLTWLTGEIKKL